MSNAAFDSAAFARSYAFLERLPLVLHDAVVTASSGDLRTRVDGVLAWREALLQGRVPSFEESRWPARAVHDGVKGTLESLGLPRFCRQNEEVTDDLLRQLVELAESAANRADETLAALARAARRKVPDEKKPPKSAPARGSLAKAGSTLGEALGGGASDAHESGGEGAGDSTLSQAEVDAAVAEALAQNGEAMRRELQAAWTERVRVWSEIESVFGELGLLTGIGFDLSRRVLQSTGWLAAARLAKLLEQLPQLRELVRVIGRLHDSDRPDEVSVMEQVFEPVTRTAEELHEVRTPFAPHEMRGIERSDALARMLPSEAVLLRHPTLKLLWHARRAERALITYRVEGTAMERVAIDRIGEQPAERPRPKPERGPLILCVDTSGSMSGLPETVAKAIALEAARTAHREKRRCLLFSFSGPGDVAEQELSLEPGGLERLLAFLSCSFGGGTDVSAPLSRAAARLSEEGWSRADLILLSDGEFPVPTQAAAQLRAALEQRGARMHGVLIGNDHSHAFSALCDPVHVFQSWGAMMDGGEE